MSGISSLQGSRKIRIGANALRNLQRSKKDFKDKEDQSIFNKNKLNNQQKNEIQDYFTN